MCVKCLSRYTRICVKSQHNTDPANIGITPSPTHSSTTNKTHQFIITVNIFGSFRFLLRWLLMSWLSSLGFSLTAWRSWLLKAICWAINSFIWVAIFPTSSAPGSTTSPLFVFVAASSLCWLYWSLMGANIYSFQSWSFFVAPIEHQLV